MPVINQKREKGTAFPPGIIEFSRDILALAVVIVIDRTGSGCFSGRFQRTGIVCIDRDGSRERSS